ncbi:MAG: PIN domain-containing protein [Chloroflexi bacterium]|nr:PIN domain-containing protein [Chloroflexota bacterium]
MTVFVDTSALYALLDADDANHEQAKDVWGRLLRESTRLICSNYVLLESIALIQRRLGMSAVREFQRGIVPLFDVHWVPPEVHAVALGTLLAAGRRSFSLVDCTSFELMHRLGIRTAFAFDRHFVEQGFVCLP